MINELLEKYLITEKKWHIAVDKGFAHMTDPWQEITVNAKTEKEAAIKAMDIALSQNVNDYDLKVLHRKTKWGGKTSMFRTVHFYKDGVRKFTVEYLVRDSQGNTIQEPVGSSREL